MPRIPTLTTERLVMRPPTPGDLEDLTELFGDPEVTHFVVQGRTLSSVQVAHMLETALAEARHGSSHPSAVAGIPGTLVIIRRSESGGEFSGMGVLRMLVPDMAAAIGGCPEPAIEMGYILAKKFWGQGFATEAAQELVRFGVHVAGKEHVIAVADVANTVSHRVLEKVGFACQKEFDYLDMRMNYWTLP